MTRQELAELGLERLIGTDLLRAYMHGYFMDNKLYERSKVVAKPSMYEEYQKEKNRQREEKRKEKRITMKQKKTGVNAELAEKWESGKKAVDERFSALFENGDYEIDKNSEEYRRAHASEMRGKKKAAVEEEEEEESEEAMLDEDFDLLDTHDAMMTKKNAKKDDKDSEDSEDSEESEENEENRGRAASRKEREEKERIKPKVRFYGVKEGSKIQIPTSKNEMKKEVEKRKERRTMSLGQRAKANERKGRR